MAKEDPDYLVALQGLADGKNYEGPFHFDARDFEHKFKISLERLGLSEKEELPPDSLSCSEISRIIEQFELPPEHSELVKIRDNNDSGPPAPWYRRAAAALKEQWPSRIIHKLVYKAKK